MVLEIDKSWSMEELCKQLMNYQHKWAQEKVHDEKYDKKKYIDKGSVSWQLPATVETCAKIIVEEKYDAIYIIAYPVVGIYFQINGLKLIQEGD